MKNFTLNIYILILLISVSCNSEVTNSEISLPDLTKSYWKVDTNNGTGRKSNEALIYFQFDGSIFNVYIQENYTSTPILTEKYPASHFDKKITLFNPFQEDEILTVIELDENNNFIGKNTYFQTNSISEIYDEVEDTSSRINTHPMVCMACMQACYAVHAELGISFLDGICCFMLTC